MVSIFLKEVRSFVSSLIAYIVVAVFLLAIGMFMWIYKDTNVLDFGEASMDTLFVMGPWVFVFLISAITMRFFAEERKTGTIETILTHPVSLWQVVFGKYLAGVVLVLFALIPTLLYYYTIYQLGSPIGNIDTGAVYGSYIGLFLLASSFVSIGLLASALTDNQIVSFMISALLCFVVYSVIGEVGNVISVGNLAYQLEWLGMNYHYEAISKGVVDTRDVVYFLSAIAIFLGLTHFVLSRRKW